MEDRPIHYDELHTYIPKMGEMEYFNCVDKKIEFKFMVATADGEHNASFSCWTEPRLTGACRQKMLKCVQQAHDWRIAHEEEKAASALPV